MSVLTADSRRDLEIHRYPVLLYGLAPLIERSFDYFNS